jgi:predicted transcriptional regulator
MTPQQRAEALRVRLIAIAQACASAGVPLPERRELARIVGCRLRQIHRHLTVLRDMGAIATVRRGQRLYVELVA